MPDVRAVHWDEQRSALVLLDQTRLPAEVRHLVVEEISVLLDAIQRLVVRGAPALGVVGAYGVAVAMQQGAREGWTAARMSDEIARIASARPTAVNLSWGVARADARRSDGVAAVLAEAHAIAEEDIGANRELSRIGADWVCDRVGHRPLRVLTHCNTGALATAGWGTALGIVRELHARGLIEAVYADETRPLLQGSRLTAWELADEGIPCFVLADGAAASTAQRGLVDVAIVGADRVARNGDTANKIGTLGVALAARHAGIPFVVAAPSTTVDPTVSSGDDIVIEMRPEEEVLTFAGTPVAPGRVRGFNPAFDVTPHDLIAAVVTEHAAVTPTGADVAEILRGIA
ncbi:MAG: S-methyl-5-thioribose-1-phosphate isomerase [Actinomycetales bacterium]|nr:S-methyl-5-thioribose-1-phosphate isomerase [Actinomycetales bacterium]